MAEHERWKCEECDHICLTAEVLEAPNPFADTHHVTGCPNCKAVESLVAACAIEGCIKLGTCGGPGADGVYRNTCYEHADWLHNKATTSSIQPNPGSQKVDGTCRKCNSPMKPGKALEQTFNTSDEGTCSPAGPGKLVDCMKCSACGWSVKNG